MLAHLDASGKPTLTPFENDTAAVPAGQGRLIVRHTAAAPAVDIVLADGSRPFTNLTNPNEASAALPAGQIAGAKVAPTGGDPIADVPDRRAARPGTDLIVYAVGSLSDNTLTFLTQTISGLGGSPTLVNTGDGLPTDGARRCRSLLAVGAGLLGLTGAGLLVARRRTSADATCVRRRSMTWLGASLLAAAAALAVAAAASCRAAPDTDATAATIEVAPSTVPPRRDPAVDRRRARRAPRRPSTATPGRTDRATARRHRRHVPLSPLAALVGARPVSAAAVRRSLRSAPIGITIDAIGVAAPIIAVGVQPDGQLEIPDETPRRLVRARRPPRASPAPPCSPPTSTGTTSTGPSSDLRAARARRDRHPRARRRHRPGPTRSSSASSTTRRTLPAERIWTHDGPETLVLITCGGSFNPDIRRYRDNIVVYAVPVASTPSAGQGQ